MRKRALGVLVLGMSLSTLIHAAHKNDIAAKYKKHLAISSDEKLVMEQKEILQLIAYRAHGLCKREGFKKAKEYKTKTYNGSPIQIFLDLENRIDYFIEGGSVATVRLQSGEYFTNESFKTLLCE